MQKPSSFSRHPPGGARMSRSRCLSRSSWKRRGRSSGLKQSCSRGPSLFKGGIKTWRMSTGSWKMSKVLQKICTRSLNSKINLCSRSIRTWILGMIMFKKLPISSKRHSEEERLKIKGLEVSVSYYSLLYAYFSIFSLETRSHSKFLLRLWKVTKWHHQRNNSHLLSNLSLNQILLSR